MFHIETKQPCVIQYQITEITMKNPGSVIFHLSVSNQAESNADSAITRSCENYYLLHQVNAAGVPRLSCQFAFQLLLLFTEE